jgi:hypothetical protein
MSDPPEPPLSELLAQWHAAPSYAYESSLVTNRIGRHPDKLRAREALETVLTEGDYIPHGGPESRCYCYALGWRFEAWRALVHYHWSISDALAYADTVLDRTEQLGLWGESKPKEALVEVALAYFPKQDNPSNTGHAATDEVVSWLTNRIDSTELGEWAAEQFLFRHDRSHLNLIVWPALVKIMHAAKHPSRASRAFELALDSLTESALLRATCTKALSERRADLSVQVDRFLAKMPTSTDIQPALFSYIMKGIERPDDCATDTGSALKSYVCRYRSQPETERIVRIAAETRGGYRNAISCAGLSCLAWFYRGQKDVMPKLREALFNDRCEHLRLAAWYAILIVYGNERGVKDLLKSAAAAEQDDTTRDQMAGMLSGEHRKRIFDMEEPTAKVELHAEKKAYKRVIGHSLAIWDWLPRGR